MSGVRWTKDRPRPSWESVLAQMGQHGFVAKDERGRWRINGLSSIDRRTIEGMVRVELLRPDRWGTLRRTEER
jgi:hypothetical protein